MKQIATLVAVAAASAAVGFAAVVLWWGGPTTPHGAGDDEAPADSSQVVVLAAGVASMDQPDEPPADRPETASAVAPPDGPSPSSGPSGPWATLGEPFYWRCWARGQRQPQTKNCDRLPALERLVAGQLSLAVRCHRRHGVSWDRGTLSLAVEANFARPTTDDDQGEGAPLRLWAGRSSTLEGAAEVVACMRREQGDVSLRGIDHRKERYVIFFPVTFAQEDGGAPPGTAAELSWDKVRLRAAPETGQVKARLRRGELLRVVERRDEWLRVKTADGREGWVFAQAVERP